MKLQVKDLAVLAFFGLSMVAKIKWFWVWLLILVVYAGLRASKWDNNEV